MFIGMLFMIDVVMVSFGSFIVGSVCNVSCVFYMCLKLFGFCWLRLLGNGSFVEMGNSSIV